MSFEGSVNTILKPHGASVWGLIHQPTLNFVEGTTGRTTRRVEPCGRAMHLKCLQKQVVHLLYLPQTKKEMYIFFKFIHM